MWIDLLIAICKLVGLISWADKLITARAAKQQAKDVANVPTDKQETESYFRNK